MKREYIKPSVLCVKIDLKRAFLTGSLEKSEETITEDGDGGWARDYNTEDTEGTVNNRSNVWDNIW